MGIFKKWTDFKAKRATSQIEGNRKVIRNAKAIREDRQAALDFFRDLENAEVAVDALLDRFEYSIENGITDSREKEVAMEGIVARGADVVLPIVRERLQATTRIAWPIKVLTKLGKEDEVIATLLGCLDSGDIAFDQAKVDKNYDILCYLRDFQIHSAIPNIFHFVADSDERVRFAAVELLIEQQVSQAEIAGQLEKFILDESPENTRIRQSVVAAFAKNGWKIQDVEKFPEGFFLAGIRLDLGSKTLVPVRH